MITTALLGSVAAGAIAATTDLEVNTINVYSVIGATPTDVAINTINAYAVIGATPTDVAINTFNVYSVVEE